MSRLVRQIASDIVKDIFQSEVETDEWKLKDEVEGDDRRWTRHNTVILESKTDGDFWAFEYEQGLTENQDNEYPWDSYYHAGGIRDTVELYRVYPATTIKTIWKVWDAVDPDTDVGSS